MNQELEAGVVSIMVPCYNGEQHIGRLLDSICGQTYDKIHLIFVNDGSKDGTERVFRSYKERFRRRNYPYHYLYQDNQGQAAAINRALEYLKGEYCMWIDADDYMTPDHVEQKVRFLEQHPDKAGVQCQGYIVDRTNGEKICGYLQHERMFGSFFEDLLFEFQHCSNGLYMVRTRILLDATGGSIYAARGGQNFQLLLPIAYSYKMGYMQNYLFYYVLREESHCHNIHGLGEWRKRLEDVADIKNHVLNGMAGLFDRDYLGFLKNQMELHQFTQELDAVMDNEYDPEEEGFIAFVTGKLAGQIQHGGDNGLNYWIWGACGRNRRLAIYLGQYAGIEISGFVDSDPAKWSGESGVIRPKEINGDTMFLLIPLLPHMDIVKRLEEKNIKRGEGYFYPKYELAANLQTREQFSKENAKKD